MLDVGPNLEVTKLGSVDHVHPEESVEISATVANIGETAVEREVALQVDTNGDGTFSRTAGTQTVSLESGDSVDLSYTVSGAGFEPGTYEYGIVVPADRSEPKWTQKFVVLKPSYFDIRDSRSTATVVRGENASLSTTVHNVRSYSDTQTISLEITPRGSETRVVAMDRSLTIAADTDQTVEYTIPTDTLEPGLYDVELASPQVSDGGILHVKQPATFTVQALGNASEVVRGESYNVSVRVTNEGDVTGTKTISLDRGDELSALNRTVTLAGGESRDVTFATNTSSMSAGNYTYQIATADETATTSLQVREGHFTIRKLRGNETLVIGEKMQFSATVTNTGDATETQALEYKLDLNGDDRPESYGITERVTLAPGENTTVTFVIPYLEDPDPLHPVESFITGNFIYGIYGDDESATSVFTAVRPTFDSVGSGGGSDSAVDTATRDEITQQKYGLYYEELSSETKAQIDEIHERQPFAAGLVVTDVQTREEIARWEHGADIEPGETFDFTALDIQTQQQVEASFDAQFQSQSGDRIKSWDELAKAEYGSEYESLTDSQQSDVRSRYQEQFE